jgi:hypothetical protein
MTIQQTIRLFLLIFALIPTANVQGQELIRGIVVDSATLNALPSVNIQLKDRSRGTTSDEQGNFSILATREDTLVFTSVGYERLELPLSLYEPGLIRLSDRYTLLEAVTIDELRQEVNPYEGMFEERNAQLQRSIPFYFSKARKEKIKVQILREENLRVDTYVDVVVNDPALKTRLMEKYSLSESEYYEILTAFNEGHYRVMYYLTRSELISLLHKFFETQAASR